MSWKSLAFGLLSWAISFLFGLCAFLITMGAILYASDWFRWLLDGAKAGDQMAWAALDLVVGIGIAAFALMAHEWAFEEV